MGKAIRPEPVDTNIGTYDNVRLGKQEVQRFKDVLTNA